VLLFILTDAVNFLGKHLKLPMIVTIGLSSPIKEEAFMNATIFEKLPEEKKQSILRAGILCFGQSGYEKTAISEIANEAGISKAAIFHYFGTKQDLFLYLALYTRNAVEGIFKKGTEDYFETTTSFIHAQLQLIKKYPGMFEFMRMVGEMAKANAFGSFEQIYEEHSALNESIIFAHVDWSKFRDEYDRNTIINLTTWVGTACLMQYTKALPLEDTFDEVKRYLAILKTALYKEEYL